MLEQGFIAGYGITWLFEISDAGVFYIFCSGFVVWRNLDFDSEVKIGILSSIKINKGKGE